MISILTPTIRKEGLGIVAKALRRQTFQDFEWLVGSPFEVDFATWVKDDFEGGFWTLNRIYNRLISTSKGELIISWQDFTYADPDTLEKFWNLYKAEPNVLVSAVGNKYEQVYPERKGLVWKDPRETDKYGTYYPCFWNDIEWNLCSIPRKALYDVGGFDEELDFRGYGMDGYGVNERINTLGGYDFKLNQTIKSYSLTHPRVGGSEDWEKNNLIHGGYQKRKQELMEQGKWPVLDYLK